MRALRHLAVPLALISAQLAFAFQGDLTLRSETNLVQINVIVRDKHGPVTNLSRQDFAIIDDGRRQEIKAFSMNVVASAAATATPAASDALSNHARSEGAVSSVTVILLDSLNTLMGGTEVYEETPTWVENLALANAKQHLLKFVAQLRPGEMVAVCVLGHQLHVLSDFTDNRETLTAILKGFDARSLTRRDDVEPLAVHTPVPGDFNASVDRQRRAFAAMANANRAEETTEALSILAERLSHVPGRKNLVWMTSNLPFPETAAARALSRAGVAVYPLDARGLLTAMPAATADDLFSQMQRRRPVAEGQGLEPTGIGEMRALAAQTGGRAFVNTNDLTGAIRQAVDDTAVTYTLGFYPATASLDGNFHKLKVQVIGRGGSEIRYPSGYFAAKNNTTQAAR